jgi:hypothetical protein
VVRREFGQILTGWRIKFNFALLDQFENQRGRDRLAHGGQSKEVCRADTRSSLNVRKAESFGEDDFAVLAIAIERPGTL